MKHKIRIEKILESHPEARNDDKILTYLVFQEIAKENGQAIFIPFNLFKKFPAFETVKRTRAKIQNEEGRLCPEGENITKVNVFLLKEHKKEIVEIPNPKQRNSYLMA